MVRWREKHRILIDFISKTSPYECCLSANYKHIQLDEMKSAQLELTTDIGWTCTMRGLNPQCFQLR